MTFTGSDFFFFLRVSTAYIGCFEEFPSRNLYSFIRESPVSLQKKKRKKETEKQKRYFHAQGAALQAPGYNSKEPNNVYRANLYL